MVAAAGIATPWSGASLWRTSRKSPLVLVLAGINPSEIVEAALTDAALTEAIMARFEPDCSPPCDAVLWRLETASGDSLNRPGWLRSHWHRPPYALTVRLVQYQPGSTVPEILDEGTLGTRGPFTAFSASVDRLAMRFVRDAAMDRARGPSAMPPATPVRGRLGWFDALLGKWHDRLMTEWWSIGTASTPIEQVLAGKGLGDITWFRTEAADRYLADPFPWPGTNQILCEEMPLTGGVGRIVSISEHGGGLSPPTVALDDGFHHSYPCTYQDGETVFCIPEAPRRGATVIYRLDNGGKLTPVCDVAPHARLADPTLFRWNGLYWLGCTDLDLGVHDNLCLLYADTISGPWKAHRLWPVKIDIRGARPAGMIFESNGALFRPGQDCAKTYGAAVAIHRIATLSETEFAEVPVATLRPDATGPFPHGLHTLVHDGHRFWVDGKRFVLDLGLFGRRLAAKATGLVSKLGVR